MHNESANRLEKGRPRVVNNLGIFSTAGKEHAKRIGDQGYQASYTMPMYSSGHFLGFLFFNSYEDAPFTEEILGQIDPFGHLISLTIISKSACSTCFDASMYA